MRIIALIVALALVALAAGCCATSSSTTTVPSSAPTAQSTTVIATTAIPTTLASVQAALDDAKIRNRNNVDTVEATMGADGVVDVTITELSSWDERSLKRTLLTTSYETMAVLVEWPGVDMVRIEGYAPMIDAQGNEKTKLAYMAIVSDMAKAKKVNWNKLSELDEAVAITNFDSAGGPIMDV